MNNPLEEIEKLETKFLIVSASIVVLGIIMVFSSSYMYSMDVFGNSAYIFIKQFVFAIVGAAVAYVVYKTKISFWIKYAQYIHMAMVFVLCLTIVPGLGITTKGSSRWVQIMGIGFQPGEPVKFTIMLIALKFFDQFTNLSKEEKFKLGGLILLPLLLLIKQPDFGTFSICSVVITFVCFISSFPRKIFYSSLPLGLAAGLVILYSQPYRVKRMLSYLDPWADPQGKGFQIIQSLYGFANGTLFGLGIGNSNEKLFYLPEAHNDFIFSVIGEEIGFFGVFIIIIMFTTFVYLGFKISTRITERINAILVSCVIFTIGLQALVNMGVVLGMLPTKGLNLPFISYGGTSLVTNLFALGLIFSAIRSEKRKLISESPTDNFTSDSGLYYNNSSVRQGKRAHHVQRDETRERSTSNQFSGF
ncbi:MAG: putative lipid II flippase FtsW [Bacteriovoracaceae bacterium]|nr:putative lipid II flippase FtsW [Bacteriovoracaceae bacterium]